MSQDRPSGAERRQTARRAFRGSISAKLPSGETQVWRGIDVSESGIGVECPSNLPAKLTCEISFSLLVQGQMQSLRLSAQVVYSVVGGRYAGFQVGCQFVRPPDDAVKTLRRYVSP